MPTSRLATGVDGNAVRPTKKAANTARVQELTGQAAEKAKITVETLMRQADEIRRRAMETRQFSAAVAAIREMGVLSGARVERKEVGTPGEFDAMSDDELLAALRERWLKLENELAI